MRQPKERFALCLDNADYEVSLIPGKVYLIIPDERAQQDGLIRIVDESGEDYLYHRDSFCCCRVPRVSTSETAGNAEAAPDCVTTAARDLVRGDHAG